LFYYGGSGLAAVRHGAYKAHFLIPSSGAEIGEAVPSNGEPQLYNLDQDPSEKFDLAAKQPELIAELRRIAEDHKNTVVPVKNQIATRAGAAGRGQ
jgi:arylsulfatase A